VNTRGPISVTAKTALYGKIGVKSLRAVAQIILASIIHSVYKDGKDNKDLGGRWF
jgi:hypothetical protein